MADLKLTAWEAAVAREILRQLQAKLTFLLRVGLGYLTLARQTRSLSGGEAQRINLANQLGSQLVGTLYVLDEPSIGLHARDTMRLVDLCRELAQAGNTVVVVEHDRSFIEAADHVVELGPGSGERGGEIVVAGPQAEFRRAGHSLTARYVSGRESIPVPLVRRPGRRHLTLSGAREHNLKDVTLRVPLATLTVVTGVSGSGKSTLVHDTLYRAVARAFKAEFQPPGAYDALTGLEYLKGVRLIDQEPIGRTPRSNPVTYVKAFDEIRKLYAALPRAKTLGLNAGAFSFNVPGGRCESCQGDGFQKLEMYFFEDVYVSCQECEGRRYRPEVLGVKYRGRSIGDVLQMTVDEAVDFFAGQTSLARRMRTLQETGLGYLRLGQPATTLSGGEAQRLKIAAELGARATGDVLYILDEPTTGLHLDDVRKLLGVLHRLVDGGNTVLVVEHHLDVIKCADHVIDLGPGGRRGGRRHRGRGTHRRSSPRPRAPTPESSSRRSCRRRTASGDRAAIPPGFGARVCVILRLLMIVLPDWSGLGLFVVAALVLLITPGPAVLYIVTRSIDQGRRAGLVSMLGVHVGTLVHVAAAAVGLSAVLVASATAFTAVKWLGAAYLVYLGVRRILDRTVTAIGRQWPAAAVTARLPRRGRRQHAEPQAGAVLPRVPAAVRRSLARPSGRADPRARPALRAAGHAHRRRLRARRGHGGALAARPAAVPRRRALGFRRRVHRTGCGGRRLERRPQVSGPTVGSRHFVIDCGKERR